MGEDFVSTEIFLVKNKDNQEISLYEDAGDGWKVRYLYIDKCEKNSNAFIINKPLARKLVQELIKEFKLDFIIAIRKKQNGGGDSSQH